MPAREGPCGLEEYLLGRQCEIEARKPAKRKGVVGRGSRTKGWGEGVRPKAEKKKVTPINSMLEVVSNVPLATSDGFS